LPLSQEPAADQIQPTLTQPINPACSITSSHPQFCDDNFTASDPPCQQDGDIPPHYPTPAIGEEGIKALGGIKFWGKRTMTNDFATIVYRMKLLGFNAVRMPFK